MLDHGQLSPPTPAVSYSPVISSSPSFAVPSKMPLSPSLANDAVAPGESSLGRTEVQDAATLGESISNQISQSEGQPPDSPGAIARPSGLVHASELSAQLISNPKLAMLRSGLSVVPAPSPSLGNARGSPLLANPKCSGYFVEPVSHGP